MRVLIAGGGIGGLTLAGALRGKPGVEVRVLERAPVLTPAGSGITVQMNAVLALESAGLDKPVRAAGAQPKVAQIRTPNGKVLSSLDLRAVAAEVGAPAYTLKRSALHQALLEQIEPGALQCDSRVKTFTQTADRVTVQLTDGKTLEGDVLVGADGLHSAVRIAMWGAEDPRYSGYTSWRGLCPNAAALDIDLTTVTETWGAGCRFGVVPVANDETYWFAVANAPQSQLLTSDASARRLSELFRGWHHPVPLLLAQTPPEQILHTDIFDRPVRTSWTSGRVVLLGDAVHPMTPNLGQGGGQAIEDAVVLARALTESPNLATAFRHYEEKRVSRANAVSAESRRLGKLAQMENPVACALRNFVLRATPEAMAQERVTRAMRFAP